MSAWGAMEGACPCCGGAVKWFDYSDDCRGNKGSAGAECLSLCVWTEEQTKAFWVDLRAKQRTEYDEAVRLDKERRHLVTSQLAAQTKLIYEVKEISENELSDYTALAATISHNLPGLLASDRNKVIAIVVGTCGSCHDANSRCQCWNDD